MIQTATVGCQPLRCHPFITRHGAFFRAPSAPNDSPIGSAPHPPTDPNKWEEFENANHDLVRDVILTQENLGLDILAEGEATRADYWSYFVSALGGFMHDSENRWNFIQTGTPHRKWTYIIDDWRTAQSFTKQPVKITLPGPMTCATYCKARGTSDETTSLAFARVINEYILMLENAGCNYIQIDDCQMAYQPDAALRYGIDHLATCFQGVGGQVKKVLHMCRGTPGFVTDFHGHGKADNPNCYRTLLAVADDFPVDIISVEHAFSPSPIEVFKAIRRKTLMLGVVNVASRTVETVDEIVSRARPILEVVDRSRIIFAPDCGFSAWNKLPGLAGYDDALKKLSNMVAAARYCNAVN